MDDYVRFMRELDRGHYPGLLQWRYSSFLDPNCDLSDGF